MPPTRTLDATLFESLQKEFCPTLDSSLIAALLFELESDNDGNRVVPTSDQIDSLRATLQELCAQADESECLSDVDETFIEQTVSSALSSFDVDNEGSSLTELSQKSESSFTSFTSPLGFLQMVLPDIPPAKLKKALDTHNGKDLWDIISVIVSEEAIRETEERDLEDGETNKEVVRSDKEDMKASKQKTAKKTKSTKFVLSDVRQQNRTGQESSRRRSGSVSDISSSQSGPPTVDPWTRISSLSSRLASLLPPHPPSIFSSFLHSPQYATSYDAVRACLRSLCKSNNLSDEQSTLLISLLDIIMVSDDIEVRSQVISDVELSVCVTEGRADDALDLAYLLHDLESSTGLRPNRFHSLPSPSATNFSQGQPSLLPPGGSLPTRPSLLQHLPGSTSPPQSSHKVKVLQWQAVPSRTKFNKTAHVGYANYTNDPSTSNQARLRMRHAKEKSRQALMDATIMFRQRNSRNYGGEVALFYAERAREWKQIEKQEALNAAREMVRTKSATHASRDVIDLHGTTVAEALVIVREILNQRADSIASAPVRIITGKGKHSAGRVGVLKPALRSALMEDGWQVTAWDAGLVVRGVPV